MAIQQAINQGITTASLLKGLGGETYSQKKERELKEQEEVKQAKLEKKQQINKLRKNIHTKEGILLNTLEEAKKYEPYTEDTYSYLSALGPMSKELEKNYDELYSLSGSKKDLEHLKRFTNLNINYNTVYAKASNWRAQKQKIQAQSIENLARRLRNNDDKE